MEANEAIHDRAPSSSDRPASWASSARPTPTTFRGPPTAASFGAGSVPTGTGGSSAASA